MFDFATRCVALQHSSRNTEEFVSHVAEELKLEFGADSCEILLNQSEDRLVLVASTHAPEQVHRVSFSRNLGLCGKVLTSGHHMAIESNLMREPDATQFPGFDESSFVSGVFIPVLHESHEDAVVILRRHQNWIFDPEEKQKIQDTAQFAMLCVAAYRKIHDIAAHSDRLRPLQAVTATIAGSPYLEEILQLLVNLTAEQFGYRVCTVRLLDETSDELVLRATQAKMPEYQRKRAIKVGESIAGKAILEQRTFVVKDVLHEEEYVGHDLAAQQGLRSMVCVPLTVHHKAVGVLTCYTDELREFSEDEVLALETIAKQAAFSIERATLEVRNTLMQEMHHRVKNNLQQIVSLLRLQLRHKHYSSIEDSINDSIGRILAIAAVHDLLSRDDLDRVSLKTVAQSLVHHIQQSILLPEKKINFDVRGHEVRLTMTQATQLALVLNELLLNSIEHGFANFNAGDVHITFESEESEVSLWIANNGNKLPKGFDINAEANLGLQIVSNLARALGGHFRLFDSEGWTVGEVKFQRAGSD